MDFESITSNLNSAIETVKETVSKVANTVNEEVSSAVDTVKEKASAVVETVEEKISEITEGSIFDNTDNHPSQVNADLIPQVEEAETPDYQMEALEGDNDKPISVGNKNVEAQEQNKDEDKSIVDSVLSSVSDKLQSLKPDSNVVQEMVNSAHLAVYKASMSARSTLIKLGAPIDMSEVGEKVFIGSFAKMDKETFSTISKAKHGERLDKSLEDYKIKVGDKEIQFITDNNIVSSEWAKQNGIPQNGSVLTQYTKQQMEKALKTMHESGRELPERIYFTQMFGNEVFGAAGYFAPFSDSNAIFINAYGSADRKIVYHETAHMQDYHLGNDNFLSDSKGVNISMDVEKDYSPKINFGDKQIKEEDINCIIYRGTDKNPQALKKEIDEMINNGIIVKNENGKYSLDMNKYCAMPTANILLGLSSEYEKKFNNVMELYNYLKENNDIEKFEYAPNPNIIEFNGKQIDKFDVAKIIGNYSLTNNLEFVACVSKMLTNGDILQDKEGHYKFNINKYGRYSDGSNHGKTVADGDIEKLNNIMELYNYLTEGKIAKAKVVE